MKKLCILKILSTFLSKKTPSKQFSNALLSLTVTITIYRETFKGILIYIGKIEPNFGKNYGKCEQKLLNIHKCLKLNNSL